ncbi:MAG: DUF2917 domain-containing protein [Bdellovibrionales bacterium]|nr:DUF2917 domain-containing protein [Bdellovibrionales bacterium]
MKQTTIMDRREIINLKSDRIVIIKEGILWVTYAGDLEDYFYMAGETITISKKRPAIMEALDKCSIEIVPILKEA